MSDTSPPPNDPPTSAESDNGQGELSMEARHRREWKELRAKIQQLKKSATKGDKKRKKEVGVEVERLERELEERHEREKKEHLEETETKSQTNAAEKTNEIWMRKQPFLRANQIDSN